QLTDAMGRVINTRKFIYHCCDRIERYDISNLTNGTYFINARFWPERTLTFPAVTATKREGTFRVIKAQ
ncbi:MAG: hypothetical protein ABL929_12950, partial [Ferruginibacter sp.]